MKKLILSSVLMCGLTAALVEPTFAAAKLPTPVAVKLGTASSDMSDGCDPSYCLVKCWLIEPCVSLCVLYNCIVG